MSGLRIRRRSKIAAGQRETLRGASASSAAAVQVSGRSSAVLSLAARASGWPQPQIGRQPMAPRVRFAKSTDIPRLFDLKWQLAVAERMTATICATEADWQREGFGCGGRFAALVAEIDGRVVGMLSFHERYDAQYQSTLYVEDLFVERPYRKLGAASALLADLAAHARARDIPRIELNVREDNRAARRLYRELGFERRRDSVISILSGDTLLDRAKDRAKGRTKDRTKPARQLAPMDRAVAVDGRAAEPIAYHVRLAERNDAARLCELKRQAAMRGETTHAAYPTEDHWIRDSVGTAHPRFAALVAESDATIVGMLTYSLRSYTALPKPAIAIADLFVDPAYRRHAIASSLIAELSAQASEHQYAHIELHTVAHNSAARAMSRKLGFVPVRHCVTYLLAGSPLRQLAETAANLVDLLN
jgi:ribosomal protein S18 acetylase RimI-like enzyme